MSLFHHCSWAEHNYLGNCKSQDQYHTKNISTILLIDKRTNYVYYKQTHKHTHTRDMVHRFQKRTGKEIKRTNYYKRAHKHRHISSTREREMSYTRTRSLSIVTCTKASGYRIINETLLRTSIFYFLSSSKILHIARDHHITKLHFPAKLTQHIFPFISSRIFFCLMVK